MMTDQVPGQFDVVQVAGYYSQLAGVLAGFAFTALVLLLTSRLGQSDKEESQPNFASAVQVLIVSFIGLVMSSLSYAILSGLGGVRKTAAALELIGGLLFAVPGVLLVYAIILTLEAIGTSAGRNVGRDLTSVAGQVRRILAFVLTPLASLYVYLGARDVSYARYGDGRLTAIDYYSWFIIIALVVSGRIVYRRLEPTAKQANAHKKRAERVEGLANKALGLIVVVAVAFAIFNSVTSDEVGPALMPYVVMTMVFVASVGFVTHLARTRSAEKQSI